MEWFFQTAARGSGGAFVGALGWLWLPVLLVALVVLLASPRWRAGVTRSTVILAVIAAAVGAGETAWRLLDEGAHFFPFASWAVTLLVASQAISVLKARETPAGERAADAPRTARTPAAGVPAAGVPAAGTAIEDPFRPPPPAPAGAWLERAVEQAADGIAVVDLEGGIELVNAAWARHHGFQVDEVRGHHLSLFHTPEQMSEAGERMAAARAAGAWRGEARHRQKDGTVFEVRSSFTLLHDAGGDPVGFLILASPRPAGEASAPAASAELETLRVLVAGVAHEYNNLLTGILGNVALLGSRPANREDHQQIADVEKAARAAAELTRQLQAYAGNVRSSFQELRLGEWLDQVLHELAGTVAGLTVRRELDDETPPVAADPQQLRILLRNLMANAADAIGDGRGAITLRAGWSELGRDALDAMLLGARRAPGAYAFVEVGDDGPGVGGQTRQRMFDPFYTTRRDRQGLGLTTVLGIVRSHRGAIAVASAAGEGTRVRVVLPCAEQSRQSAPAPSDPPMAIRPRTPRVWQGSGTVLVVDNEQIIRDLARSILEIHGFSVLTAADGEPALELFRERRDDIRAVLLDLSMPLMDGREVFERLRSIDPQARVIVMTGHAVEDVQGGFRDGLAGVLQKPFKPEQLIGILRHALKG